MVKQIKFLTIVLCFIFSLTNTLAQNSTKNVKENSSLVQGVFLYRDQFLKQQPAFLPDELYHSQGAPRFSIRSWSNKDSLYVYIKQRKQTIPRDSVWGFYDDGNLFLQRNGYFHKVTLLGSISLFNEIYPLVKAPFTPVTTDATKEIIQSIIDLHSGKFFSYSANSMMELLQSDEVLFNNFKVLSKKMRKKMMYSYIERFNDRHPLF